MQYTCDSRDTLRCVFVLFTWVLLLTLLLVFLFLLFKRELGVIDFHEPGFVAAVTPVGTTAAPRETGHGDDGAITISLDAAGIR